MRLRGCAAIQPGCVSDYIAMPVQTVKEHLKGYEKGLTDAKTTPRSKEVQMATVQAKLQGYSEVQRPPFLLELFTRYALLCCAWRTVSLLSRVRSMKALPQSLEAFDQKLCDARGAFGGECDACKRVR